MSGNVIISILIGSGGVIKAESIIIATIACRRYFLRNFGVTNPTDDKISDTIGISKIIPAPIISHVMKLK